jgi:hypothetical protein
VFWHCHPHTSSAFTQDLFSLSRQGRGIDFAFKRVDGKRSAFALETAKPIKRIDEAGNLSAL